MTRDEIKRRAALKKRTIELMWEDGFPSKEIARTVGTTDMALRQLMKEMRRQGAPLERRRA